jgi:hypothetical protein
MLMLRMFGLDITRRISPDIGVRPAESVAANVVGDASSSCPESLPVLFSVPVFTASEVVAGCHSTESLAISHVWLGSEDQDEPSLATRVLKSHRQIVVGRVWKSRWVDHTQQQ